MTTYRRRHHRTEPRSWFSLFLRFGGWAAIVLAVALLVTTLFSAGALFLADRIDRDGALAYATVTDKRAEGETRFVTFTFKARGGGGRTETVTVDPSYYDSLAEGDERPVRYDPETPGAVETDLGFYARIGARLRWGALVLGLLGLAALWAVGQRANRAIKVRRDGDRRMADVMGVRDLRLRIGGAQQGRLTWREPDGRTGESFPHDADWLRKTYGPGDQIVVFRLGRHACWEGDVGPSRQDTESA
ncbi:DUF3592 domain-containing protein [Psychromarinibacter halotolerans]|uniref:DUF3592 domain-containing protein n=1 Tax=Psychromarinibacter halotolerans TaxID=1775175 RepID=A0ABV7GSW6_9RHOB|nr:DUF3592 domain-containing protein [Psychromarinibacter halotolerans]MDF0597034.1 hypothetical protein [Psychromarinibacter halotolerans]